MTEYECEIRQLEAEVDKIIRKSRRLNSTKISDMSLFELQKLKVELNAEYEKEKTFSLTIALTALVVTFLMNLINLLPEKKVSAILFSNSMVIVLGVFVVIACILSYRYSRESKSYSEVIGLIDLLIEKNKYINEE
ncbi:hypothetical protein [Gracilibacillus massiliensis]|uniref:hypothetical protein n=1 Tax=Gracilibacillus massiliensis TaxID=1564956 RepID=UPI00071D0A68|nr:hypothetical protein [Gracilibacillus massiliensis]